MAWLQENGALVLMGMVFLFLMLRGPLLAHYYRIGSMSVHELSQRLAASPSPLLIDVRTPAEYAGGHVREARSYPLGSLGSKVEEVKKAARDKDVVVICRTGNRSLMGSVTLKRHGMQKVYNVPGGMMHWEGQGYPVKRG
ncbi:MAG: rhodanese-like domain-containing protein [Magnetococcales bacterium]|nr:rhodanese-like domain-containing protein [Magnetococcales bacterium]MBF0630678.1 rhodanese-like domain-containing protein [Magnetococcales bacterium]